MIGVVRVTAAPGGMPDVAGLSLPLRGLLALQAAGVTALAVTGDTADAWLPALTADDRLRMPVTVARVLPQGEHLVVDGALAFDPRTARALVARTGVLFLDGTIVAVHRMAGVEGDPLQDAGEGAMDPSVGMGMGVAVRVTDAASARTAEDRLLASLRKPQDGMISRALNRTVSLACTRVLCRTGLRPNSLSAGILGIGLGGAYLASRGTWGAMAVGGVLFQAQSILDGCDGELSRLTYRGSRLGEWLDTVGDDVTNYSFFAGCAAGLAAMGMGRAPVVLGAVGVTAGVVTSGIAYRYLLKVGSGDLLKYPMGFGADAVVQGAAATPTGRLLDALRPFFKRDFFVFATMLAVIAGRWAALGMLGAFALGACITLLAALQSEWRRRGIPPGAERGP